MTPIKAEKKLEIALELYEVAEGIMIENIRRRHPNADSVEMNRLLQEWLNGQPHDSDHFRVRASE